MVHPSGMSKLDKSPSAPGFRGKFALFVPERGQGVKQHWRTQKRKGFQGFVVAVGGGDFKMRGLFGGLTRFQEKGNAVFCLETR